MASGNSSAQWQVQWAPYSWPVTSSIIGLMEASGSGKVALLSIGGRKMVPLHQPQSKFPPLLMLLPSGPIVSQFIEEVMTSTKQSSCSNLRVGGVHSMALSQGQVEDSSASCLLAGGPSTWLNMVVGDGWWPSSGPSILRPSITSSWVIFTNSQIGLPQLSHTLS